MTVKELIKRLEEAPPEAVVLMEITTPEMEGVDSYRYTADVAGLAYAYEGDTVLLI